jgi:hypothetical protein
MDYPLSKSEATAQWIQCCIAVLCNSHTALMVLKVIWQADLRGQAILPLSSRATSRPIIYSLVCRASVDTFLLPPSFSCSIFISFTYVITSNTSGSALFYLLMLLSRRAKWSRILRIIIFLFDMKQF